MVRCLLGFLVLPLSAVPSPAQDDALLAKVLADWAARRDSFTFVRYTVDGEFTWVKNGQVNDFASSPKEKYYPSNDVKLKKHRTVLLDYVKNRHRIERRDEVYNFATGERHIEEQQLVYNGTEAKVRNVSLPPEQRGKATVGIVRGDQRNGLIDTYGFALHVAHGNIPWDAVYPGQLKAVPDPGLYRVLGPVHFNGRQCLIVREGKRPGRAVTATDYWVDPARGSIIVRMIERVGSAVVYDLVIQYSAVGSRILPESWVATKYNDSVNRISSVSRMRLVKRAVEEAVADTDFDLVPRPGELVSERTNSDGRMWDARAMPPATYYRADDAGELVPVTFDAGQERRLYGWSDWLRWGLGIPALAALVLLGWKLIRPRRGGGAPKGKPVQERNR